MALTLPSEMPRKSRQGSDFGRRLAAIRKERGLVGSPFVAAISGPGRRATAGFYGVCLALTLALFGVVLMLWKTDPLHLRFEQYYYMGVLSCLLIHYTLDGFLFTVSNARRASMEILPFAAPAVA